MDLTLERNNSLPPAHNSNITSELAHEILAAAITKSDTLGLRMNIAIVDVGANLKAFHRMDEAWIGSIDIACKKTRTARFFDMPTGTLCELSQPGGALYNNENSNEWTDLVPRWFTDHQRSGDGDRNDWCIRSVSGR